MGAGGHFRRLPRDGKEVIRGPEQEREGMMSQHSEGKPDKSGFTRRGFLKAGALGTAAALAGSGPSCRPAGTREGGAWRIPSFELEEKTLEELGAGLKSGEWTCRRLAELYMERIAALDKEGPGVNAVLELNPDALRAAEQMDRELKEGLWRGSLHGIPILIKGNIDTADGMTTAAGSLALLDSKPSRDAFIVRRLQRAGAVILGKANLSEWANFRSTRSSSGWSSQGGQTKNPYALDRNPSGSSSGSAAGLSANFCAVAVGTETDGSVVSPSSLCGVVGIKPTIGLVSRNGIIPIAHSQDTAGPMGRTVADAASLLYAMAGKDADDPASSSLADRLMQGYKSLLDGGGLKGARIGVARRQFGFHEKVDRLMEEVIAALKSEGAVIFDPAEITPEEGYGNAEWEVLLYEFKADIKAYLDSRPQSAVKSLADLIAFNEEHRAEVMPFFEQELFLMAEKKGDLTTPDYLEKLARCRRLSREEGIDKALKDHKLDAVIAPTDGPAWKTDLVTGDHYLGGSSTPAAVSGYASITVPAGHVFGLPVGVSFIGGAFSEPRLITLAYAFERATKHRRPPKFLAAADLSL
jgi:amidase